MQKDWLANLHGHGHSEGSIHRNTTLSTIASELLIFSQKTIDGTSAWAGLSCETTGLLCSRSMSQQWRNFNKCSSGGYILNGWTFCKQTWHEDTWSQAGLSCRDLFSIFKVTVAVNAHIIKILLFLKYRTAESDQMQTKWTYTDHNTVTSNITKQNGGWGWEVAEILPESKTNFVNLWNSQFQHN